MMEEKNNRVTSCLKIFTNNRNGWIVCIVSILLTLARSGIMLTFGIYIAEFRKLYGTSMTLLNWISITAAFLSLSLSSAATYVIQLHPKKGYMITALIGTLLQAIACLSSSFVDNIYWLFLTYGVLFGVGSCYTFMASTLIFCAFFPKSHEYHVFVTSIFQCAFPAGLFIFSPIYGWIIENYSWRWSFRIAAIKIFIIGIIGSFLFLLEKPVHEDDKKDDTRKIGLFRQILEVFKKVERLFWLAGITMCLACQYVIVTNLPHYMEDRGFSTVESSFTLTMIGIFQLLTYLTIPFFGKLFKGNLIYSIIFSTLGYTLVFLIWSFITPPYGLVLGFSAVMGFLASAAFAFLYAGSAEAMDMEIEVAWTITCTVSGVGTLLGPLISGLTFDYTHSYKIVFHALTAIYFAAFAFFAAIPLTRYLRKRRYERIN